MNPNFPDGHLDVADRIRWTATEQSEKRKSKGQTANEQLDQLASILQVWSIATLLLGAGAEHLEATVKQRLAKRLIEIAALAIDEWTQINAQVDFERIKQELTTKEMIEKHFGKEAAETDFDDKKKTIVGLVDILEYSFLGEPFRRTVNHLCERARLRVLAPSVERADINTEVEKVIYGAWLADIDGKRGKQALRDAIKNLPPAPFLRIMLATHFLTRVYWSHWKEEDRLMLLDAAAEVLKAIKISVNKPKIKRAATRVDEREGSEE